MDDPDLIKTGIDRLLAHIERQGTVDLDGAAESLGADKDRVLSWARALESSGMIEISYTATRGRVLKYQEEVEEEDVEAAKEQAREKAQELRQFDRERADLKELRSVLARMEKELEEDEEEIADLVDRTETREELEDVRAYLEELSEAEDEIDELRREVDHLLAGLSTIERMASAVETRGEEGADGLIAELKRRIPFIGGEDAEDTTAADGGEDEEEGETFKCDECGREFETLRGLQTHRGMVHHD